MESSNNVKDKTKIFNNEKLKQDIIPDDEEDENNNLENDDIEQEIDVDPDIDIDQDIDVEQDIDIEEDIDIDPDDIALEDDVEENNNIDSDSERGEESKEFIDSSISNLIQENSDDENYDSEESDDEPIDNKIKVDEKLEYIKNHHTQEITEDYEEIAVLSTVQRNEQGIIIDSKHTTTPIMTKYEKTRILGLRISQLNNGAPSLHISENTIIDNNIIAEIEIRDKLLPFIISRPLPNGGKELWRIQDLEIL